jgi:DNA-binding transcriptional ArsR family regulator
MPLRDVDRMSATGHPLRRRMLRQLRTDRSLSSVELSLELSEPLRTIDYHLRVLQLCNAARPTARPLSLESGAIRYQSAVCGDRFGRGSACCDRG